MHRETGRDVYKIDTGSFCKFLIVDSLTVEKWQPQFLCRCKRESLDLPAINSPSVFPIWSIGLFPFLILLF